MRLVLLGIATALVVLLAVLSVSRSVVGGEADKPSPGAETDPLSANAGCYVCHIPFVKEELSKVHLKAKVACVKCHGLCDKHANDENIGATKPDITYKRHQIDAACVKCHEKHDAPALKVIARFQQRRLPPSPVAVCTECHGTHKIEKPEGDQTAGAK